MSSENYVGIIMAENLRFLGEGSSAQGVAAEIFKHRDTLRYLNPGVG